MWAANFASVIPVTRSTPKASSMLAKRVLLALVGALGVGFATFLFSMVLSAALSVAVGLFAYMIIPPATLCGVLWGGLVGWRRSDPRREYTLLQCSQCGYSLHGSSGDACPECGCKLDEERKHYRRSWLYGQGAHATKASDS